MLKNKKLLYHSVNKTVVHTEAMFGGPFPEVQVQTKASKQILAFHFYNN